MRPGQSVQRLACVVLAIAIGAEKANGQSPTHAASSTVASRRLPHRMTAFDGKMAQKRRAPTRRSPSPPMWASTRVATPSMMFDRFLKPTTWSDTATYEPIEVPRQPVGEVESIESIWQTPNVTGNTTCDGNCCVTGPRCWPGFSLDHLSVYGGVQASKNNSNQGEDGSFGFQQGVNFGMPAWNIILPASLGLQVGFQANQSNLDGAAFTDDDRKQYFVTVGAFRRADCGLQGGLVFDYLRDKWYYDLDAGQVRGEISMALSGRSSFGFWFTNSTTDNEVQARVNDLDELQTWETMDIYAIFYRTAFFAEGRGEGHLMAGLTQDSDGIIGGKTRLPLSSGWAVEAECTYLIPEEQRGLGANEHESWNMAINMVWYPGSVKCGECVRYHRPLFDVANNGSMILRRVR